MRNYYMILNDINIKKAFGDWLYQHRIDKLWTQFDLAEKLDVSQNTVSRWEIGEVMPSRENLQNIAGLFGVTVEEIFAEISQPDGAEKKPGRGPVAESNATQEPDSKSLKEKIHELETELYLMKAENMRLKNQVQKLKTAMAPFIE